MRPGTTNRTFFQESTEQVVLCLSYEDGRGRDSKSEYENVAILIGKPVLEDTGTEGQNIRQRPTVQGPWISGQTSSLSNIETKK